MSHRPRAEVLQTLATKRSLPPVEADTRLSVVVPAYGEAAAIAGTIERIRTELDAVATDGGIEIVVVDDGSGDGTADAARRTVGRAQQFARG